MKLAHIASNDDLTLIVSPDEARILHSALSEYAEWLALVLNQNLVIPPVTVKESSYPLTDRLRQRFEAQHTLIEPMARLLERVVY